MEEWRVISEFPEYQVSNLGRVKGFRDKILQPYLSKRGYYVYNFHIGKGKQKTVYLHRLLCEAFVANPDNKECVDHINRNKLDNSLSNLRWATKAENGFNRQRGRSGEAYITQFFKVSVPNHPVKHFATKEEAIAYRDSLLG